MFIDSVRVCVLPALTFFLWLLFIVTKFGQRVLCGAPSEVAPREVRFAHPRQAAPATPFTRSRATMPPEEPPPPEPGTLALVRGKRFNAHGRDVFEVLCVENVLLRTGEMLVGEYGGRNGVE